MSTANWGDTYGRLAAADAETPLDPEDLERLAMAAYLIGRDAECTDALTRAHRSFMRDGDVEGAARSAFWVGFRLVGAGQPAQGNGWLAISRRLLDTSRRDSVVHGYLLLPEGRRCVEGGDGAAGYEAFGRALAIGDRFGDVDLVALARHGQGRALVQQGDRAAGVALLDEVMATTMAGALMPITAGVIYCSLIDACDELFDLRRAQEWTAALTRWCASQPDMVPYRGHCLVRRAAIMQLRGAWSDAMDEARRACERVVATVVGAAYYQCAELHRLRGELAEADAAYAKASEAGRSPQPGLALLRLAQGRLDAAATAIRRAVAEARTHRARATLLRAYIEIMVADDDVVAAREGADALAAIAADFDAPFLRAASADAAGAVRLAGGDADGALDALHDAWGLWRELEAPYEAARVRVLMALGYRARRDEDAAATELAAARRIFERLGATTTDVERVVRLAQPARPDGADGLTARERQVLALIATGKTNRAIAGGLGISEKTVARHVSNIFTKLRLSTRSAATAYAYRHAYIK